MNAILRSKRYDLKLELIEKKNKIPLKQKWFGKCVFLFFSHSTSTCIFKSTKRFPTESSTMTETDFESLVFHEMRQAEER